MKRTTRFLTTSAVILTLAAPAFAQSGAQSGTDTQTDELMTAPEISSGMDTTAKDGTSMNGTSSAYDTEAAADEPALKGTTTETTAMDATLPSEPILTAQTPDQMVSDDLIGMDVRNQEDESIGTIDALVIDGQNRVVAGIVSVGGFLGIGAKEVAVNWQQFRFLPEEEIAAVSLSREQLENAPAFRESDEKQAMLKVEESFDSVKESLGMTDDEPETPVEDTATTD